MCSHIKAEFNRFKFLSRTRFMLNIPISTFPWQPWHSALLPLNKSLFSLQIFWKTKFCAFKPLVYKKAFSQAWYVRWTQQTNHKGLFLSSCWCFYQSSEHPISIWQWPQCSLSRLRLLLSRDQFLHFPNRLVLSGHQCTALKVQDPALYSKS